MVSKELLGKADAIVWASEREPLHKGSAPLRLQSEANTRDKWRGVERAKLQRGIASRLLLRAAPKPTDKLVVLLTRVAPRRLDSDNLARSLKAVRDGVADALKRDDGDPSITWLEDQRAGAYAVEVAVWVWSGGVQS